MKPRILSLVVTLSAALVLCASMAIASESGSTRVSGVAFSGPESKVAYRYYYPAPRCYYVKKCVRANRWGQCVKFRWFKKCAPVRVL